MAVDRGVKRELEEYLRKWIEELARKKKTAYLKSSSTGEEQEGDHKPFHRALLPRSVSRGSNFERSLSSGLGSTYEHCAEVLARQNFSTVERQHDLPGYVPADSLAEIDNIVHEVGVGKRFPNYRHEVQRLVRLAGGDASSKVSRDVRSDLYVSDGRGVEIYMRGYS